MKLIRKTLLVSAAAATLAVATMASARADSFAQSILTIDNFRLLHSNGTPFNVTDFGVITGTNDAIVSATLNGVFANGAQSFGILSGTEPDVAHQTVGAPSPAKPENNFVPFGAPPAVPGTFGYADQYLAGSSITIGVVPAGATAQTRADASLAMNGSAAGTSSVGTSTTFSFTLGLGDTMTVAFDGTPFTQAYVSAGSGPTTNANARLSWNISIRNNDTGALVFFYQPVELNALSTISRTDGTPGLTTYDPGTAAFAATTGLLATGVSYQLTIEHNTLANALQAQVAVAEPATLAIFGFGLLGMSALARRKS